ncbi:MAG TPA: hypothetical protein VH280_15625 [Verrucomicrobiae bacterium]|jgi:hypothetical protein|nr:hypothetical protein [Verrucomicrobiae bacterium]
MKTTFNHWLFGFVAWVGFVVSFFLPAFDQMPGWRAAILQKFFWPQAMQGNPLAIHYLLLTFANLVMIISPFFMAWGAEDIRFVKWLRGLSLAATVVVWLFLVQLQGIHSAYDLRIGYFLWAGSFVLLGVAAVLQPATVKAKVDPAG